MSSKTNANGGITVLSLLGIVFVTLKLLKISDVATWSWWWVTMPFWGGFALFIFIFLIIIAIAIYKDVK